ncbi:hypothetical protein LCGC14_1051450 [marine sediment metagenome]|uniref:Uncharacterized protein n=1 Tax=marine sediment metagenome TaxID=412755 RepID=A0A0F9Q6V4_9ZZZZ
MPDPLAAFGIRVTPCKHVDAGKMYMIAKPTEGEVEAYQQDLAMHGWKVAIARLAKKLGTRSLVIHNIGKEKSSA